MPYSGTYLGHPKTAAGPEAVDSASAIGTATPSFGQRDPLGD